MRLIILTALFIIALFCCPVLHAQQAIYTPLTQHQQDSLSRIIRRDTVQQRDVYDAIRTLFGDRFKQKKDTVTAKPVFSLIPALGYTLQSKLAITLAGNVEFRLSPDAKISTIIINTALTQTKQVIIPIQSSVWTKHNKYNFVGDIRYLKYPESTWGLGSNSSYANEQPMDFSFIRFNETVLKQVIHNYFIGAGYIFDDHYNIKYKPVMNGAPSGYTAYGAESHTISSGYTLNSLFDSRDNPVNASKGIYVNIQFRDNLTALGSVRNWQSLTVDVRKYITLPAGSNNVLALWSYDWLVLGGRPPYLDLPSNTWDTFSGTGRGYIQGRFRGAQMVYGEAEYRYRISRDGLFGGVVFVNAESFSAAQGTRLQSIQPAFGPGLRVKLNKVSKTNIAIDYGIGREGSRGLFINVGEIF